MCRSTVDIQSAAAEIRRGEKKEERRRKIDRNHGAKIQWPALLHMAAIIIREKKITGDGLTITWCTADNVGLQTPRYGDCRPASNQANRLILGRMSACSFIYSFYHYLMHSHRPT